jgi:hypothetical protein
MNKFGEDNTNSIQKKKINTECRASLLTKDYKFIIDVGTHYGRGMFSFQPQFLFTVYI